MSERIIWDGWCSIKLPHGWAYREEDGIITLFDPDGVGALQISFARREEADAVHTMEALDLAKSFASSRGWNDARVEMIPLAGATAARFDYVENKSAESTYWCVWQLVERTRAAFITYVCNASERNIEMMARDAIVQSFQWA